MSKKGAKMAQLLNVRCPHCDTLGQILLPPPSGIIIGPCPECQELVVVFMGHLLPLDKTLLENCSMKDQRNHVYEVISEFLREGLKHLIHEGNTAQFSSSLSNNENEHQPDGNLPNHKTAGRIINNFTIEELQLLDSDAGMKKICKS